MAPPAGALTSAEWNARYGNTATNSVAAIAVFVRCKARFPGLEFGGVYNCRKQRGTGSNPNRYSVHSVGGAVDVWAARNGISNDAVKAYAKSLPGVWDAWLDESPGDVHIQIVPNPPEDWIPPCAGGSGAVTAPPGAIVAARALKSAGCPRDRAADLVAIAGRESSWIPTAHTYGQGCGPGQCGRRVEPGRVCENSWGLWQINWCAHENTLTRAGIKVPAALVAPAINARAAGLISGNFADLGPWRGLDNVTDAQKSQAAAAVAIAYGGAAGGGGGGGGAGGGDGSSTTTDVRLVSTCAEVQASRRAASEGGPGLPWWAGILPGNPAAPIAVGEGLVQPDPFTAFIGRVPTFLKILAGGVVMGGGLALILAGATGNTSKLSNAASGLAMRTPAGRVVERRRAISSERGTQRRRSARVEAESRVDERGAVTRRRVYVRREASAARAELNTADEEYGGSGSGGRVIESRLGRRRKLRSVA